MAGGKPMAGGMKAAIVAPPAADAAAPAAPRKADRAPAASLAGLLLKRPPRLEPEIARSPPPLSPRPPPPAPTPSAPLSPPPAPRAAASPPPPLAVPSEEDPRLAVAWWRSLLAGQRWPGLAALDRKAIAAAWPAAVLLTYDAAADAIERALRIGTADDIRSGLVEYTPMLTEWLLALARRAAEIGAPVEEERSLPGLGALARYRIMALPFSAAGARADHILCRIRRL
jgi:hypothetical protein